MSFVKVWIFPLLPQYGRRTMNGGDSVNTTTIASPKPFQILFLEFLHTAIILLIRYFCYFLLKGCGKAWVLVLVTQALPKLKLQSWLVTDLLTSVST